jgi:hypothetical protein
LNLAKAGSGIETRQTAGSAGSDGRDDRDELTAHQPLPEGDLVGVQQGSEVRRYPHALSRGATPTSTTVGVTRLAGLDFMIEIQAIAVVNS